MIRGQILRSSNFEGSYEVKMSKHYLPYTETSQSKCHEQSDTALLSFPCSPRWDASFHVLAFMKSYLVNADRLLKISYHTATLLAIFPKIRKV